MQRAGCVWDLRVSCATDTPCRPQLNHHQPTLRGHRTTHTSHNQTTNQTTTTKNEQRYLGYHTPAQVAAGAALGVAMGLGWWAATEAAGDAGLFAAVAAWPPAATLLGAKDTWGCAEPLLAEQHADYPRGGRGGGGGGSSSNRRRRE